MRTRNSGAPAPSSLAITAPIRERARQRVPRRVEHFQGELTPLEGRVQLHADGKTSFGEIALRLGISEAEVVAVAISLSGIGAIVLTAVPPPLPKRPASGTRPRAIAPILGGDATPTELEIDIDLSDLEAAMGLPFGKR